MKSENEKEVEELAKNINIIKCFQASAIYTPDYYEALCLYEFGYRNCTKKIVLTQEQFSKCIKENVIQFAEKLKEKVHERDYLQGYAEIGLCEEIDETLEERIKEGPLCEGWRSPEDCENCSNDCENAKR